jgi:hypothetical protein
MRAMSMKTLLCCALAAAVPTQMQAQVPAPPREVNITTDSAPGWLPSEALERQAMQTMGRFFAALDGGDFRRAYDMMTAGNRNEMPFAQFAEENGHFHAAAGPLRQRRMLKLTWTKDPADAQYPGIYAAIDVAAHYANVDRECGYVLLYQRPAGGNFEIMRTESYSMHNEAARRIEQTQSRAELDRVWAELARHCPNFTP